MGPNEVKAIAEEIIKSLGDTEITPMTKEETAILIQRQIELANALITFNHEFLNTKKQFDLFQAEIAASQSFIDFKGLRKEYQYFKNTKLKVFNRNHKSK